MMHMLIFGHGYSAAALTPRLIQAGWTVSGTTRNDADRVAASGARPLIWRGDEARLTEEIGHADAILISIAPEVMRGDPDRRNGPDKAETGIDPVLQQFRAELRRAKPGWVGYLSSTNIYGDHGGDWVDEDTPPRPATARGKARLDAEQAWSDLAHEAGWPLTIFRLAGIYGPDRGPLAKLRSGTARRIIKPGQVFSRIHVDDIAGVLVASIDGAFPAEAANHPLPVRVFNLCDDDPAPPDRSIEIAAEMAGLPVPPAETIDEAEMTPMARSFYADSKRVRNDRMKSVLGYDLLYPDLEAGLRAILASEKSGDLG
ncbi:SDR family oxidoreductase [Paracoccus aerodenitrificans]|uniref:SDR family oxidoreductase n=1 Tax=Paracoccus aerodenitrificans TaxID=3017781 RepID=UPI0022F07968|nr:SDR family oxidoreductase [Paracoccus aerodenitrificans]WBU64118.1 SDR family oxidoreductase [Paracoccus aerodenitrificans]